MSTPSSPSLAGRAVLAILLMIGFYLLAIALVAGLLASAYWLFTLPGRNSLRFAIPLAIAGLTVAWAVLPRIDRFIAPGPEINAAQEPRLFQEIEAIAAATQQDMPKEVYMLAEPNAFVTHRGGIMGFGSKRVMGIGLPLLQGLTVPEFKAVLAHEFGHYHGGDTALGPWIYKTRGAIVRSVNSFRSGDLLRRPFEWYGKFFLQITQSISRQQEFAADALAAQVVGANSMISGLQKIGGLSLAYNSFWQQEYVPLLKNGARLPLASGFERYLRAEGIASAVSAFSAQRLNEGKSDIYDSHPAEKERIAALSHAATTNAATTDAPAITLLDNVPAVEKALLDQIVQSNVPLNTMAWEEVAEKVWVARYNEMARQFHNAFQGTTIATIPALLKNPVAINNQIRQQTGKMLSNEEIKPAYASILGAGVIAALIEAGWKLYTAPGEPSVVRHGDQQWQPFPQLQALVDGQKSAADWQQEVEQFGIGDLEL